MIDDQWDSHFVLKIIIHSTVDEIKQRAEVPKRIQMFSMYFKTRDLQMSSLIFFSTERMSNNHFQYFELQFKGL